MSRPQLAELSDPGITMLAEAAGLQVQWQDFRGRTHHVQEQALQPLMDAMGFSCATPAQRISSLARLQDEARGAEGSLISAVVGQPIALRRGRAFRYRIEFENGDRLEGRCEPQAALPAIETWGYHRLLIDDEAPRTLAVAPPRCFGIADLGATRRWGLSVQVHSLRRDGDGGIGDFGSVIALARAAAAHGADAIAISPVHAPFGAQPERFGPYSPSSRLLRNPLLADAFTVFDAATIADALRETGLGETFASLERAPLIDPAASARAKLALFAALHRRLHDRVQRDDFARYCHEGGDLLREHAVFELLHRQMLSQDEPRGHWRDWPAALRDPRGAVVTAYAREHRSEVEFQMFLQWLASRSQQAAQQAARDAGMAIGLIGDLAVGSDGAGSQGWSRQGDLIPGVGIGAPPDELNIKGQNWGLSALSPHALRRQAYRPFIELLRASMQHVGGVRLDHVFALQRLWLIPDRASAAEGAYLQYPITDLLRLVALESWRHRAIVIGEDLGTMPDGFASHLGEASGVLGMRVLWFQREHGLFVEPSRWPRAAVAMTTTHDLPSVAGWWRHRDLVWRAKLDLLEPGVTPEAADADRERDREALWNAFVHAGVAAGPPPAAEAAGEVARAAAAFIGSTPAQLAILPVEDALALDEQPNIPGTTDEHPNWLRRLPDDTATAFAAPETAARLAALAEARRT